METMNEQTRALNMIARRLEQFPIGTVETILDMLCDWNNRRDYPTQKPSNLDPAA
jgi:hypothetical protein